MSLDDPNLPPELAVKAAMLKSQQERLGREGKMGFAGALSNSWRQPIQDKNMSEFQGQYQKLLQDAMQTYEQRRKGVANIPSDIDQTGQTHSTAPDPEGAAREAMITGLMPMKARGTADYAELSKTEKLDPGDQLLRGGKVIANNPNRANDSVTELRRDLQEQAIAARVTAAERAIEARAEAARKAEEGRAKAAEVARTAAAAKPNPGHRWKDGIVGGVQEPIPGSKEDTKLRGAYNSDTATRQASQSALDRLDKQVDLVLDSKLDKITGIQGVFPNIPGGNASVSKARLDTLKYQVGFSVLQELRATSRNNATGLGQVTEKEHVYLQAQLGNLERAQSEAEIRRVLQDIKEFIADSKDRIESAYNMKHKDSSYKSDKIEKVELPPLTEADMRELEELRKDPTLR